MKLDMLYHNVGAVFFEMGWREDAIERLKKGIEKFPEDEEMKMFLREIEDELDDSDSGSKTPLLGPRFERILKKGSITRRSRFSFRTEALESRKICFGLGWITSPVSGMEKRFSLPPVCRRGEKRPTGPLVEKLHPIPLMHLTKTQLERLPPEDRTRIEALVTQTYQGFEQLLEALDPQRYSRARTYIENLIHPVTTFFRWWLPKGELIPPQYQCH